MMINDRNIATSESIVTPINSHVRIHRLFNSYHLFNQCLCMINAIDIALNMGNVDIIDC